MTPADDIRPERLEELLAGSPPRDDAERDMVTMMAELRGATPPASDALRERIAALAEEAGPAAGAGEGPGLIARLRDRLAGAGRRGWIAVAAPLAAAVLAAAVILPAALRDDDPVTAPDAAAFKEVPADAEDATGPAGAPPADEAAPASPALEPPAATGADPLPATGPADDRVRQVTAWIRVRVSDAAAVDGAALSAEDIARASGGAATGDARTPAGGRRMVLRIPPENVDAVIEQLGGLGTVLGQDAQVTDITARLRASRAAVARQRARLAALRADAAAAPDDIGLAAAVTAAERRLTALTARRDRLTERANMAVVRVEIAAETP